MFNTVSTYQYLKVTNIKFIWEVVAPDIAYVEQVQAGIIGSLTGLGFSGVTCEVYGAEPPIEWTKWLLIGGGILAGGAIVGYVIKK